MATSLEEITGGVPKAPHPPSPEDILGPPPHAPRIGKGGPIGSARRGRSRPPSPPHLAKPTPQAAQQPVRQTVIQEVKPQPYKPPVATPENTPPTPQSYRAPRGMGVKPPRARRQAQATKARKDAEDWRTRAGQLPIEGEGMSPEVKAKRAQQYAEMKGTLDALRKPAEPSSGEATP